MTEKNKAILNALNDLVSIVDDTPWDIPMLVEHYETVEKQSTSEAIVTAAEEVEKAERAFNASNNWRPCTNGTIMHHIAEILRTIAKAEGPKINEPLTYLLNKMDAETATAILDGGEKQIRAVERLLEEIESRGCKTDYDTVEEYAIAVAKKLFNDIEND